ncbi:MAG: ATP-binding cassette domain-containing protein [Acidimicrobiia bacterium]|nr:ATP-binding cassette domain-containing protein [Acidimicrobiia bacterium]MBP8182392.1 ATP-binding cassette domain-containing protein [Acidimicrobiia bacterium]
MLADNAGDGLQIVGLTKRYDRVTAVEDLNLSVRPGEVVGFLGPNGAGKTTTMRALLGMTSIDVGKMGWNGQPITDLTRRKIGYMPQERGLYARMRVREQIEYFGRLARLTAVEAADRAAHWIAALDLGQHADALVQELSGGNQQRVQLAVALVHDPPLLVLDEPFAGLDPIAADTMRRIISERADQGAAVLFSSHQLDMVEELCDSVVIVAHGREVMHGAVAALRSQADFRVLSIEWSSPQGTGAQALWSPDGALTVRRDGAHLYAEVLAETDFNALLSDAARSGSIASISIEPPSLEHVFSEAVAAAQRAANVDKARR